MKAQLMPTPTPDDAHAAISISRDVAFDWATWSLRLIVMAVAGVVAKLFRDVAGLLSWKTQQSALSAVRDDERREMLGILRRMEERQNNQGERVARLEGRD